LIKVSSEKIGDEESFKKMLFPFYELENHNRLEDILLKREDLDEKRVRDLRRLIDDLEAISLL
jgi:hypothetical protein